MQICFGNLRKHHRWSRREVQAVVFFSRSPAAGLINRHVLMAWDRALKHFLFSGVRGRGSNPLNLGSQHLKFFQK